MSSIERRASVRKPIRMPCVVQLPSGITINGYTRDLSLDGVMVETPHAAGTGARTPSSGEMGILTLKFRKSGVPSSLMAQCRVVHISGNGLGLAVQFSELNKQEQEIVGAIISRGRPEID